MKLRCYWGLKPAYLLKRRGLSAILPALLAATFLGLSVGTPSVDENPYLASYGRFYLLNGQSMLKQGQLLAAAGFYKKALQLLPKEAAGWFQYAQTLDALDRDAQAAEAFSRYQALTPDKPTGALALGLLYGRSAVLANSLGIKVCLAKSQQYLEQALAQLPPTANDRAAVLLELGTVYAMQNQHAAAVSMNEQYIKLKPASAEGYNNYGYALANLGRWSEAELAIDKAMRLRPNDPATLDSKGFVLFGQGQWAQALKYYEQALTLDNTIADVHLHRAQVLEKLNRPAEAAQAYEQFLTLSPRYQPDRENAQARLKQLKAHQLPLGPLSQNP